MAVTTELGVKHVNALEVGVVSGRAVGTAVQKNNRQRLQHYCDLGYSVYFPAGQYELDGELAWSSTDNVKVWGDDACIYQMNVTPGTRVLHFEQVNNVEVTGLHTFGSYLARGSVVGGQKDLESHIYCARCTSVMIHHNRATGSGAYTYCFLGGNTMTITDNVFADGEWVGGTTDESGDIAILWDQTLLVPADSIIISRNQCNTNTLLGISSLRPAKNMVCTDNIVIAKDASGVELTQYSPSLRKAGIELQYYADVGQGNDNLDSSQYEMVITGNKVQGARYSAISFQSFTYFTDNSAGVRGTVSNNVVRYSALEQEVAPVPSAYVQNGITVNNCRDLVIANNVIKDVENVSTNENGAGSAAIFVRYGSEETIEPAGSGGTLKSCIIQGNIITDCRSHGIWMHDVGDILIDGNMIRDVDRSGITGFGATRSRQGTMTITNNHMVSQLASGANVIQLTECSKPDMIISNNRVEYTAITGTTYLVQLEIAKGTAEPRLTLTGNRFVGAGAATRGVYLNTNSATDEEVRYSQMVLANNSFAHLDFGYFLSGNPGPHTRGPILSHNDAFDDVDEWVWSQQRFQLMSGSWANGPNTADNKSNCVVRLEADPASITTGGCGNWLVDDVVWHSDPAATEPMGWICTVAGQGDLSTWIPMATIP